jgi:hypothetical protein
MKPAKEAGMKYILSTTGLSSDSVSDGFVAISALTLKGLMLLQIIPHGNGPDALQLAARALRFRLNRPANRR